MGQDCCACPYLCRSRTYIRTALAVPCLTIPFSQQVKLVLDSLPLLPSAPGYAYRVLPVINILTESSPPANLLEQLPIRRIVPTWCHNSLHSLHLSHREQLSQEEHRRHAPTLA